MFAPRHHVAWKAHNAAAMRTTLDDNATWLRRLLPILDGSDALDTIRATRNPKTTPSEHPMETRLAEETPGRNSTRRRHGTTHYLRQISVSVAPTVAVKLCDARIAADQRPTRT
jgi:hypothetical protein